jgi:hypothetical protein
MSTRRSVELVSPQIPFVGQDAFSVQMTEGQLHRFKRWGLLWYGWLYFWGMVAGAAAASIVWATVG